MKSLLPKSTFSDSLTAMRRCGYGLHDFRGERSFVRRLARDLYPRFHVYVEDKGESWSINLHLDQRRTVYEGATAHAGEYDGDLVEREMERIKEMLARQTPPPQQGQQFA